MMDFSGSNDSQSVLLEKASDVQPLSSRSPSLLETWRVAQEEIGVLCSFSAVTVFAGTGAAVQLRRALEGIAPSWSAFCMAADLAVMGVCVHVSRIHARDIQNKIEGLASPKPC